MGRSLRQLRMLAYRGVKMSDTQEEKPKIEQAAITNAPKLHVHGKRLKENLVRVQTLSSGQRHVTIPAPLARAANVERGDVVEWRICKSTGKLELTVLKNYVPPEKEAKQEMKPEVKLDESSAVHSSEHGQASQ